MTDKHLGLAHALSSSMSVTGTTDKDEALTALHSGVFLGLPHISDEISTTVSATTIDCSRKSRAHKAILLRSSPDAINVLSVLTEIAQLMPLSEQHTFSDVSSAGTDFKSLFITANHLSNIPPASGPSDIHPITRNMWLTYGLLIPLVDRKRIWSTLNGYTVAMSAYTHARDVLSSSDIATLRSQFARAMFDYANMLEMKTPLPVDEPKVKPAKYRSVMDYDERNRIEGYWNVTADQPYEILSAPSSAAMCSLEVLMYSTHIPAVDAFLQTISVDENEHVLRAKRAALIGAKMTSDDNARALDVLEIEGVCPELPSEFVPTLKTMLSQKWISEDITPYIADPDTHKIFLSKMLLQLLMPGWMNTTGKFLRPTAEGMHIIAGMFKVRPQMPAFFKSLARNAGFIAVVPANYKISELF